MQQLMTNVTQLKGTVDLPSDKSMSHRAALLAALAKGTTTIHHYLLGEDCLATLNALEQLGVSITRQHDTVVITGVGNQGFVPVTSTIDVKNSGTTMRLLSGILATIPYEITVTGDQSLRQRPMQRIVSPLQQMGATLQLSPQQTAPIRIKGHYPLHAIDYTLPVASAQVKSAIILAGLHAEGTTHILEPKRSRNHTEDMLPWFGGNICIQDDLSIHIPGMQQLEATECDIPADISSAAFFMVAAILVPNSQLQLKKVPNNPTRNGICRVLRNMGAVFSWDEISGDMLIGSQQLKGTVVEGDMIPIIIDELPLVALLATQATGDTLIKDAKELRVKETDRIKVVTTMLNKMGAHIEETEDGMIIHGETPLHQASVSACGDHRIAMMLAIAALIVKDGPVYLEDPNSVMISYPTFFDTLLTLQ